MRIIQLIVYLANSKCSLPRNVAINVQTSLYVRWQRGTARIRPLHAELLCTMQLSISSLAGRPQQQTLLLWPMLRRTPSRCADPVPHTMRTVSVIFRSIFYTVPPKTSTFYFLNNSVLWRCWLGGRKGIRPVKNEWWGVGVVICLEWGADLHTAQLMPLPLTVSCFSAIQTGFYARCYASAVLAMACVRLFARPSVRPSQVGVLLKRLNVGSHK